MRLLKTGKSGDSKNSIPVSLISFMLRTGIAAAFLYAAIASILEPEAWMGFLPSWLRALLPANMLLLAFAIYQVLLSLWLISGVRVFYAAVLSSLTLLSIIVFNIFALDIVFRDIPILFASAALAMLAIMGKGQR